jgi:hypothetical protein
MFGSFQASWGCVSTTSISDLFNEEVEHSLNIFCKTEEYSSTLLTYLNDTDLSISEKKSTRKSRLQNDCRLVLQK